MIAASMLSWLLRTRWPRTFEMQFWFFTDALGSALFEAAFMAFLYLGLEPQVRRVWPDRLIGWSRLLAGRWSDPCVGREVLWGVVLAIVGALAEPIAYLIVGAVSGEPPRPFHADLDATGALSLGLGAIFLVVILLSVLRGRRLALAAFVLIVALAAPRQGETGMLAIVVAGFCHSVLLGDWPLGPDATAWYAAPAVVLVVIVGLLLAFGWITSARSAAVRIA